MDDVWILLTFSSAAQDIIAKVFPEMIEADKILDTFGPGLAEEEKDLEQEFLMCVDLFKSRSESAHVLLMGLGQSTSFTRSECSGLLVMEELTKL